MKSRFGKKTGIFLIVFGVIVLVVLVVLAWYINYRLAQGFLDYLVYVPDPNFSNPNYTVCTNTSYHAYFYNITNLEAVYAGEEAIFEQVGPYNYTQGQCVFDVSVTGNIQYYREYWPDPYMFAVFEGGSESDLIYNFNPGYLGILQYAQTELLTSLLHLYCNSPELIFSWNFNIFPVLIEALTGPNFVDMVQTLSVAEVFLEIEANALQEISSEIAYNTILDTLAGLSGNPSLFFNDVSVKNGVAYFYQTSESFSETCVSRVLYGDPSLQLTFGWLNGSGEGISEFLKFASNASNAAKAIELYNVTQDQLLLLVNYTETYLLSILPNNYEKEQGTSVASLAFEKFCAQWANASNVLSFPVGFEVNTNFSSFSGSQYSLLAPSNISLSSCEYLWSSENSFAMTNTSGIEMWFDPSVNHTQIGLGLGLTDSQTKLLMTYLEEWRSTLVISYIEEAYGTSNISDLGYLQWGSASLTPNGESVSQFSGEVPPPPAPEFAVFAESIGSPIRFNLTESEEIWNNLFMNPINVTLLEFLVACSNGECSPIENMPLTTEELNMLYQYSIYVFREFLYGDFLAELVANPNGGGPITARTPREWLFDGQDPLLKFLGKSDQVGFYYDVDKPPTMELALTEFPLLNQTIYLGGSSSDLYNFLQQGTYNGSSEVTLYAKPFPVTGYHYETGNFVPPMESGQNLTIFFENVDHPLVFTQDGEFEVHGINLWRFHPVPETWENSTAYSPNALYYQNVTGLLNVSAIKAFHILFSRPNMFGVDPSVTSRIHGLTPTPYDSDWYFGVEPESGIVMAKLSTGEVNFAYPNMQVYKNISSGMAPILWIDDYKAINASEAAYFLSTVNLAKKAALSSLVLGIVVGVLLIGAGAFVIYRWYRNKDNQISTAELELYDVDESFKKSDTGKSKSQAKLYF